MNSRFLVPGKSKLNKAFFALLFLFILPSYTQAQCPSGNFAGNDGQVCTNSSYFLATTLPVGYLQSVLWNINGSGSFFNEAEIEHPFYPTSLTSINKGNYKLKARNIKQPTNS